jgi:hypothetical protein
VEFLRCIEGQTRDGITNDIFREVGIQHLLTEFEANRLQLFFHVDIMDRTSIPRRALGLEFKGKRPGG